MISKYCKGDILGRLFSPEDAIPGGGEVVLLTEEFWARHFGSDPEVIGRTVRVDGALRTVVGVIPRATQALLETTFFGPQAKEILLPLAKDPAGGWAGAPNIVARLRPGLSVEEAQERLDAKKQAEEEAAAAAAEPAAAEEAPAEEAAAE